MKVIMGVLLAHTINFLRDTNPYLTALYDNIGFLNHIKSISQESLPASAYPMLKLFVERIDIVYRPVGLC